MTETQFYQWLLPAWFVLAGFSFILLFFIRAPYGRYTRPGWGPRIDRRLGWILMESPSALFFLALFLLGQRDWAPLPVLFLLYWEIHYCHRSFIFPFQMRGAKKQMTLIPVALAVVFNLGNGYLNGRWLFHFAESYPASWLYDFRFLAGSLLFWAGFFICKQSDRILRGLRVPGDDSYHIPHGGLFSWISCPNYFGEILQWCGWALATWSLAGLSFAVWTAANLLPRAHAHHQWYSKNFPGYPPGRKALIPFLY